jgi:hypothetical protein
MKYPCCLCNLMAWTMSTPLVRERVMSVEVKVSLGDIYITTTQDDSELAIKEAMQTIADEISIAISKSSQYEIVGDQEGESDD